MSGGFKKKRTLIDCDSVCILVFNFYNYSHLQLKFGPAELLGVVYAALHMLMSDPLHNRDIKYINEEDIPRAGFILITPVSHIYISGAPPSELELILFFII